METVKHPISFDISVTVKPDLSVEIDDGNGNITLWQFNFRYMMALSYTMYIPNTQNYWHHYSTVGITELEEGICLWNGFKWDLLDPKIQEAYSSYIAEKELLDE